MQNWTTGLKHDLFTLLSPSLPFPLAFLIFPKHFCSLSLSSLSVSLIVSLFVSLFLSLSLFVSLSLPPSPSLPPSLSPPPLSLSPSLPLSLSLPLFLSLLYKQSEGSGSQCDWEGAVLWIPDCLYFAPPTYSTHDHTDLLHFQFSQTFMGWNYV